MAGNAQGKIGKGYRTINPALFALYAGEDLDTWRTVQEHRVIHNTFGQGVVVKVEKGGDDLLISIRFDEKSSEQAERKFARASFQAGKYFSALTLPVDLFRQLEPELPRLEAELQRAREAKTQVPAKKRTSLLEDAIELAWSSLDAGSSVDWIRLAQSARILSVYRAAKDNRDLPNWKLMQETEKDPLIKCALLLLWAKYNPSQAQEAFARAHNHFQEYVIEQAWSSTEPLSLYPLLPSCQPNVVPYCEGRPWPTADDKQSQALRATQAFCPRTGHACYLASNGAHIYAQCSRPWTEWSLLELLEAARIVPALGELKSPDEYVPKLAGWVNRLNEIRERLKCSACGQVMIPKGKYAKSLAKYNATVFNCQNGPGHDQGVYLSHCWACRQIIDSRESKINKDGYYICIHCGSGPQQSSDYTQGDLCPKCGTPDMVSDRDYSRRFRCLSCNHTIKLPPEGKLTGTQSKQKVHTGA